MPKREPHLTEKWDEAWRDVEHPDIKRSPMYYISKALNRHNLAPKELAAAYLTGDIKTREKLSVVTFDEAELRRLQADVMEDPQKYINAFLVQDVYVPDMAHLHELGRDTRQPRLDEREYWFRILNDGRCPVDAFPYRLEWEAYSAWADDIQNHALDQLKYAISQLLFEIEESKKNGDKQYEGVNKSKQDQLLALMEVVNSPASETKRTKDVTAVTQSQEINGDRRPATDLKMLLTEVLGEDRAFA